MPETIILPTPTPYKHFIPTPTPFVSVIATPDAPASLGIVEPAPVKQFDWILAFFIIVSSVVAGCIQIRRKIG